MSSLTQNLTDALDLLDDCAAFYRNSNDTIKRLLNQAIFEKIYISCEKGSPVKVEAEFNPPFDMLVEPFTDELIKVNRAIRMSSAKTIKKAKDRILRNLRCGLSDSENKGPYSEADFFTYKFMSKALLVERTRLEDLSLAETLENKGVEHAIPFHPTTNPTSVIKKMESRNATPTSFLHILPFSVKLLFSSLFASSYFQALSACHVAKDSSRPKLS